MSTSAMELTRCSGGEKRAIMTKPSQRGPGSLTQALGINIEHTKSPLTGPDIWLEDRNIRIDREDVISTPRIGIDYAEEHALLPWRFLLSPHALEELGFH